MTQLEIDLINKVEQKTVRSLADVANILPHNDELAADMIVITTGVALRLIGRALAMTYTIVGGDEELYKGGVEALFEDIHNVTSIDTMRKVVDRCNATHLVRAFATAARAE